MSQIKFFVAIAFFTALSGNSSARELWVDKDALGGACSDSRPATAVTKTAPLCSLGAAANMVAAGDTVRVRGGTYNQLHTCSGCEGRAVLQLKTAGTASQWIRFVAEPGERVILEGAGSATIGLRIVAFGGGFPSFNEISGFEIRKFSLDCVSYDNVPDIRLIGLDVSQCTRLSVGIHHAQRVTLEKSKIHDSNTNGWTSAVDLYLCKDGNIIRGNTIWNNSDQAAGQPDSEGHGIILDYCGTTGGVLIENNLIYNNEGWCIVVLNSNGATIRNNICYHNGIRQDGSGELSTIGNNLSINNNVFAPRTNQLAMNIRFARSDFTVDTATVSENNNLFAVSASASAIAWGGSVGTLSQYQSGNPRGWGTKSLVGSPAFTNEAQFNFRPLSTSAAIDKGDNSKASVTDFDGNTRPVGAAVDIGAFEFGAVGSVLSPPTNLRVIP